MLPTARPGALTTRRGRRTAPLASAVAIGALSAVPAAALAQDLTPVAGVALNQLEPSAAGDPFFASYSPAVVGRVELRGYVMADYANRPLGFIDGATGERTAIVENQLFARGDVSLALFDRVLLDVNMPVAVLQSGTQPPNSTFDFNPPTGIDAGDLRLAGRVRIAGDNGGPFQLGVQGDFFVPTGPAGRYAADGAFRAGTYLLLGGRIDLGIPFLWNVQGGGVFRTSTNPSSVNYGAGLAARLIDDRLQISAEAFGSTWFGDKPPLSTATTTGPAASSTGIELSFGAKLNIVSGLQVGAAFGPSITKTVGTPDLRGIAMIAWAPVLDAERPAGGPQPDGRGGGGGGGSQGPAGPVDSDGDGLNDDVDACPKEAGGLSGDPSKDGCPLADKDKDGVEDVEDACPTLAGARRSEPTKNGCPDDTDGDGVYDPVDACPQLKGSPNADPAKNGCAADGDGDGIPDAEDACVAIAGARSSSPKFNGCPEDPDGDGIKGADDACPMDKGPASSDKEANGCPDSVRVTDAAILLRKPIEFVTYGKDRDDTIDPLSDAVLKQVRDAIQAHPEILKIEVQGHTDDSGDEEYNNKLSQQRAEAVRSWLVGAGVAADKLVAKGYGFNRPVADNRIRTGRRKNRRVELIILERRK